MPIYEYRCDECQQVFEEWQSDFKDRDFPCPVCGGNSQRLISNTSFVLKGSGWYVTDYNGKKNIAPSNGDKSKDKTESSKTADKPATQPAASTSPAPS